MLKPEIKKIVDDCTALYGHSGCPALTAQRVQDHYEAILSRNPVKLSNDELSAKWDVYVGTIGEFLTLLQDEILAKQRQPRKRKATVYICEDEYGNISSSIGKAGQSPPAANLIATIEREYDE